ncbi:uncharacterized protein LOC144161583 [Haemaphysalis longicornis]
MPPTPQQPIVCSVTLRQRDPLFFNGTDGRDAEDWLSIFERVSTYNKWDDTMKLNNVGFYFTGLDETWFNNNRSTFTTWPDFKAKFTKVFGRPALRKLQAEQRLRERAQQAGETFTSYIEDVVDLCRRANPAMAESDKIKHILKGIEDDAFQMLLSKNPQTISDVVNWCQSYDELRKQRIFTRQRLSREEPQLNVLATSSQLTIISSSTHPRALHHCTSPRLGLV